MIDHSYEEADVLTDYVWTQCYEYMTHFERSGWKAVIARGKLVATDGHPMRTALERMGHLNDPAVVAALELGESAFRAAVRDRVLRDHPEVVQRCPRCQRVLRTPRAKQCRWCQHDWHTPGSP